MAPTFFAKQSDFRKWLKKNHKKETELVVGFYKVGSGKPSMTWSQSVDEALCFGWIDGVRKRLNDTSFVQRFTPRRAKSIWSLINVRHVERLRKEGRMQPAGLAAFEQREAKRTGVYSFENRPRELSVEFMKQFQANKKAWDFFQSEPPYIRRVCVFWVMSAKKEETKIRRLEQLIESSAKGQRRGVLETKPQK